MAKTKWRRPLILSLIVILAGVGLWLLIYPPWLPGQDIDNPPAGWTRMSLVKAEFCHEGEIRFELAGETRLSRRRRLLAIFDLAKGNVKIQPYPTGNKSLAEMMAEDRRIEREATKEWKCSEYGAICAVLKSAAAKKGIDLAACARSAKPAATTTGSAASPHPLSAALAAVRREPKVRSAAWLSTSIPSIMVGVVDDGTRRDGYAEYICLVLRQHGVTGATVRVMAEHGRWKELGRAICPR